MRTRKNIYADNIKVLLAIQAEPVLWAAVLSGDSKPSGEWLNTLTANFWIWENALQPEVVKGVFVSLPVATNTMAVIDREVMFFLCSSPLDCRNPTLRAELISRLGGIAPLIAALTTAMKRRATNFERIISVGAGTIVSPATSEYEPGIDAGTVFFDTL